MMRARGPTGVGIRKPRYSTQCMPAPVVYRTELKGLERLHEGKVRDIYAVDEQTLLIVTTDRLSAFDVVLPDPIPDKGRVLNGISNFWFARTRRLVPNHLTGREPVEVVKDRSEEHTSELQSRVDLVCRLLLEKKKKKHKSIYRGTHQRYEYHKGALLLKALQEKQRINSNAQIGILEALRALRTTTRPAETMHA